MTNGQKRNKAVEFVHNVDLSQRVAQLSETLKKETREDRRKELQLQIDNLAYNVLSQNKEDLGIDDQLFVQINSENISEPQYEDLYKSCLAYTQLIPLDRVNSMLKNNLEDILTDLPNRYLDSIGANPEFTKALGDDNLVREYSELSEEALRYKSVEGIVSIYKEKGSFDDEKQEKMFYASIAESVGEKFKKKLKDKGYSESSQNIGANLAALSAAKGLIKKEIVDKSADDAVKKAEEKFREYETKKGKKLVDYVKQGLPKLVNEKDTEKYNLARDLVYGTAKTYVKDEKLDAKDEDYFRLLAA